MCIAVIILHLLLVLFVMVIGYLIYKKEVKNARKEMEDHSGLYQ